LSLSLLVALILLSLPTTQGTALHLALVGVLLALSLRFDVAPLALIALLFAGIDLRLANFGEGYSDVAAVTRAAIDSALAGGNPYGHGYAVSNPPGAPFAYGPLTLLWYLPARDPRMLELAVSFAILGLLALRGRPLGMALFALTPILIVLAGDGSNDTSAGLLLLIGLVSVGRLPRTGAFILGLAIAFKPYALAWALPLVAWAGAGAVVPLVAGASVAWLPAVVAWGLSPIARSFAQANDLVSVPSYSLGEILWHFGQRVPSGVMQGFRFVAGGLLALALLPAVRSQRGVIVGGTLIFLLTLYAGFWSTFAYLAAIAPLICWYVDDWLGPADARIAWPADPYAVLAAAVDRRWPRRAGRTIGGREET
jgi:hypothetical protein